MLSVLLVITQIKEYEIEIDRQPINYYLTYPLLKHFSHLFQKKFTDTWIFKAPIGKYGLKVSTEANAHSNLKVLYLRSGDFQRQQIRHSLSLSNPYIEALALHSVHEAQLNIHFESMVSLKEVCLIHSELSFEFLNSLPETVNKLTLNNVTVIKSNAHAVSFPNHLRTLIISDPTGNGLCTFEIANPNKLHKLGEVYIVLRDSSLSDIQLGAFIHSFPTSVKRLKLSIVKEYRDAKDAYFPELVLSELHPLDHFSFTYNIMVDGIPTEYDISDLPLCRHVELDGSTFFIGQFSQKLESLTIELGENVDNFREFWKEDISRLRNLYFLKLTSYSEVIDFRGLRIPKKLHTIEFVSIEARIAFIFDNIPRSLQTFYYNDRDTNPLPDELNVSIMKYRGEVDNDRYWQDLELPSLFHAASPFRFVYVAGQ
ncbi:unnamed protein product [Ambrosiozyma monospora]|uniref:Unnamed protein product n=1 Tax=Ambrosiozyma monospora TaxID=43982 RepID=A0ACB5SRY3_AMBMO|nr:unnamed protein product [Ambrosiozyma monospora]